MFGTVVSRMMMMMSRMSRMPMPISTTVCSYAGPGTVVTIIVLSKWTFAWTAPFDEGVVSHTVSEHLACKYW